MATNFMPLTNDIVFNHIFSQKKIVVNFIKTFFMDFNDGNVEVLNEWVLPKVKYDDKSMRSDIVVVGNDTIYNIEAYTTFGKEEMEKSKSYVTRIFGTQIKRGKKYIPKRVIQLNICEKCEIKEDEINKYGIVNYKNSSTRRFGEDLLIYVIDLDKLRKNNYNVGVNDKTIKYFKMFNGKSIEELRMIAKGDENLKDVVKCAEAFLNDEENQWLFDKEFWIKRKERNIGEKIGKKAGRKAEKINTAKKMLAENFEPEIVCKITELPLNEILKLESKVQKA